jgi:hypothetical protein
MIFWSSAEASPEAIASYRNIRKKAEETINGLLKSAPTDTCWADWKWAFIAIIISPTLGVDYPERAQSLKKNKVLEFRLRIDFMEFVDASVSRQAELIFTQLHRSVDLMAKWGVSENDRKTLHDILIQASSSAS